MNIFVLDLNPKTCAEYTNDRHVVKMILESAQILCTVLWKTGAPAPYRSTHSKHPCTLWAGQSLSNWKWLKSLALCLDEEYCYRYDKRASHKSAVIVDGLPDPLLDDRGMTSFALAMPNQFKSEDPVVAYRAYYMGAKRHLASWKKRGVPDWWK